MLIWWQGANKIIQNILFDDSPLQALHFLIENKFQANEQFDKISFFDIFWIKDGSFFLKRNNWCSCLKQITHPQPNIA